MHLKTSWEAEARGSPIFTHKIYVAKASAKRDFFLAGARLSGLAEQTTAFSRCAFHNRQGGREKRQKLLLFVYYQREVISFSFNFMLLVCFFCATKKKPATREPRAPTTRRNCTGRLWDVVAARCKLEAGEAAERQK